MDGKKASTVVLAVFLMVLGASAQSRCGEYCLDSQIGLEYSGGLCELPDGCATGDYYLDVSCDTSVQGVSGHCCCLPANDACPDTLTVVSDMFTQVDGHDSIPIAPHPQWLTISGADWVWYQDTSLNDITLTETKTFTRSFNVDWPVESASLEILADNGYKVWVNGILVDDRSTLTNHNLLHTYDVTSKLTGGNNTITVEVTNYGLPPSTSQPTNPGGLAYKITVDNICEPGHKLPEFGSHAAVIALLTLAPAAAYVLVRRKH